MEKPGSELQISDRQIEEGAVVVVMTLELLAEALRLPSSFRIVGVGGLDTITRTVTIRVEGPGLPQCAGAASPFAVLLGELIDG